MSILAELHCHTFYSKQKLVKWEGLDSPEKMVETAKKKGLKALAITDHDEVIGALKAKKAEKKYGVTVIVSEEITTGEGDLIAHGVTEKILPNQGFFETLDKIKEQGAVCVAPHPFAVYGQGVRSLALNCDLLEEFNSICLDRISNKRAKKFAIKHKKHTIVGSDAHYSEMIGYAVNEINCENSEDSILKALKKGKVKAHQKKYMPVKIMHEWSVKRINLSTKFLQEYFYKNYSTPKRWLAEKLLAIAKKSPGKIDYPVRALEYLCIGGAILYSGARTIRDAVKKND